MNVTIRPFHALNQMEGETAVIELRGEINGSADAALAEAYNSAASQAPKRIVLDFSRVVYINSTGIALIVGILAKARAAHLPLSAVGLSDHFKEIFTITRLSDFIEIQ